MNENKDQVLQLQHDVEQKAKAAVESGDYSALTEMIRNRIADEKKRDIQSIAKEAVEATLKELPQAQGKAIQEPEIKAEQKGSGYKTLGEMIVDVHKAYNKQSYDPRLKALSEGAGADGGYTVPQEFYSLMEKRALEQSVVRRSGAMVIPSGRSNTIKMPLFKDTTHAAGALFGGWTAYMGAEAAAMSESSPKIDQVQLSLNKLYLYTYLSEELLEDNAVGLEALLNARAGDVIAWKEDSKFLNGTGVGEPLGIINSSAFSQYDKAAASAIALADLAGMLGKLFSNSFSRACWYANPSIIRLLVQVAVTNAVWIDASQGATKSPPATIFGMPLYWTEHCPELNTPGDLMLVDPTWYCIYDKPGLRIDIDKSVRFNYDQQTLRVVKRFDGRPLIDSTVTLASGSTTQSPFIGLSAS